MPVLSLRTFAYHYNPKIGSQGVEKWRRYLKTQNILDSQGRDPIEIAGTSSTELTGVRQGEHWAFKIQSDFGYMCRF